MDSEKQIMSRIFFAFPMVFWIIYLRVLVVIHKCSVMADRATYQLFVDGDSSEELMNLIDSMPIMYQQMHVGLIATGVFLTASWLCFRSDGDEYTKVFLLPSFFLSLMCVSGFYTVLWMTPQPLSNYPSVMVEIIDALKWGLGLSIYGFGSVIIALIVTHYKYRIELYSDKDLFIGIDTSSNTKGKYYVA